MIFLIMKNFTIDSYDYNISYGRRNIIDWVAKPLNKASPKLLEKGIFSKVIWLVRTIL